MINRKRLSLAVHSALVLGAGALIASSVQAQEAPKPDETKNLDTVQVTGSRIKRVDAETASPVFSINKETIEKTGALTIGDFLQDVPAIAGAATNPQVNNGGGDGAATVSLRGLGSERTLLLINGRRVVYNDVNSIPMSMVQSIEVLKDGASAIYGSDAVGGVVNFILKSNYEGLEARIDYGIASRHDGERQGASVTWGVSGDRGNVVISANYMDQAEIASADRAFSAIAASLSYGAPYACGSSRVPNGRYVVNELTAGIDYNGDGSLYALDADGNPTANAKRTAVIRKDGTSGTDPNDFRAYAGCADSFNYQAVGNVVLTPQERAGLFISSNFDITENVTAYVDAFNNRTRSAGIIAPLPFDGRASNDNIPLSAANEFNPFGQTITDGRLRLSRIGNRTYSYATDVNQFTAGLKGSFGESSWTWDANAIYGKLNQDATSVGYLISSRLIAGLGPSKDGVCYSTATPDGMGGFTYSNPIANCSPLDFFGAPPVAGTAAGDAQLAAFSKLASTTTNHTGQWLRSYQANFSGDLFDLPAGTVQAAFGIERREDRLEFVPDQLAIASITIDPISGRPVTTCEISSEACTSPTVGELTTTEAYAEFYIPILDSLSATVGTRFSEFSNFDNVLNSKLGLEWRPTDGLMFRGTYAQVFRAPQIGDLYSGVTASSDSFIDPCEGYTGPAWSDPNTAPAGANAACQNVPNDGEFEATDTQLSAFYGGNPDLEPEDGTVTTIGMVYEPSFVNGLSLTVDFWKAELDKVISNIGTQNILNTCFKSTVQDPSALCDLMLRDDNGEMYRVTNITSNIGSWETQGIDFGFKYQLDTDIGAFRVSMDTTYLDKFDTQLSYQGELINEQSLAGTFTDAAFGGQGNYSEWRALGNITWTKDIFDVSWNVRYVGGYQVGSEDPNEGSQYCADSGGYQGLTNPVDRGYACAFDVGSHTYHNLQAGVKYEKLTLRLGIDNVFDKQPTLLYQNTFNGNVDVRTYDTAGRYFWTSLSVNF